MTARKRRPANRTLPKVLRAFFIDNPDEELTLDDVAEKFDVSRTSAATTINRLNRAGTLEYAHVVRLPERGRMNGPKTTTDTAPGIVRHTKRETT